MTHLPQATQICLYDPFDTSHFKKGMYLMTSTEGPTTEVTPLYVDLNVISITSRTICHLCVKHGKASHLTAPYHHMNRAVVTPGGPAC